jgi:hypothetical protein
LINFFLFQKFIVASGVVDAVSSKDKDEPTTPLTEILIKYEKSAYIQMKNEIQKEINLKYHSSSSSSSSSSSEYSSFSVPAVSSQEKKKEGRRKKKEEGIFIF